MIQTRQRGVMIVGKCFAAGHVLKATTAKEQLKRICGNSCGNRLYLLAGPWGWRVDLLKVLAREENTMARKTKLPRGMWQRGQTYYARFSTQGRLVRKRLSTDFATAKLMQLHRIGESFECGGQMKIISFIERHQSEVIRLRSEATARQVEKILRHCGLWEEARARAPPSEAVAVG